MAARGIRPGSAGPRSTAQARSTHFSPQGKWVGRGPDPALPSEPSALEPGQWRTQFHQPEVQKSIEQTFTPFQPKKAKTKGILWGPPTKKKLAPWMKTYAPKDAPPAEDEPEALKAEYKKGLYHFDPIVVRRRELFSRLYGVVNYFNYRYEQAQRINAEDALQKQEAQDAMTFFRRLETMKTADLDGFVEVMQEAEAFMQEVRDNPEKFSRSQPTPVHTFEDGYVWVHLHTETQFKTESDRMNHCIGGGGYYCKFERGQADYYSLRDPKGVPHASMEVTRGRPGSVVQVRGHSNQRPQARYQPYIRPFINRMGWNIQDEGNVD